MFAGSLSSQIKPTTFLPVVRPVITGKLSYNTTAYVEQFWRLPGNTGFDSSIYFVQKQLEQAGYVQEGNSDSRLTYRLERRPLHRPAWEPIDASLTLVGEDSSLLRFSTNRNMITINSFPTPEEGVEAEVVFVPEGDFTKVDTNNLRGKILLSNSHAYNLFEVGIKKYGALGALAYAIPPYNRPDKHIHSIPFTGIPYQPYLKSWVINLSTSAYRHLKNKINGATPLKVKVKILTRFREADELTLVAELKGDQQPDQRMVYSAHVQEPGANDNATGVGTLTEMAVAAAQLFKANKITPGRTMTFLWGDEIRSTARFINEDSLRAKNILWGMSLDMTGENTAVTGGTFLVEKMPDPSAIWTRGKDRHTEWGAGQVLLEDLRPHYFNDLIYTIALTQGRQARWTVNTNPFEGGSDHQPFLDAGIPGVLLWHFTDEYYHTDQDRLDKVSATEMRNVATTALACGLYLTSASERAIPPLQKIILHHARKRLKAETKISHHNMRGGGDSAQEKTIMEAWRNWYLKTLISTSDLCPPQKTRSDLKVNKAAQNKIDRWSKLN